MVPFTPISTTGFKEVALQRTVCTVLHDKRKRAITTMYTAIANAGRRFDIGMFAILKL
jgi:hypothetical protein